jgi:transposase
MRPVTVYAKPPDPDYHQLVAELHQWRTAARIVMVLLSAQGYDPVGIAGLLHYHPATVRRWIHRHHTEGLAGLPDRPRSGRPRLGGPRLSQRILKLLAQPKRGRFRGSGGRWDGPL